MSSITSLSTFDQAALPGTDGLVSSRISGRSFAPNAAEGSKQGSQLAREAYARARQKVETREARDFGLWPGPALEPELHITPRAARVRVYADGCAVRGPGRGAAGPGGVRGVVTGFSAASRRRLIRALARVRAAPVMAFVTLTYPGRFSSDWRVWKRDIAAFRKRLERSWGDYVLGGVWRFEVQPKRSRREERIVPHFHFILFCSRPLPALKSSAFRGYLASGKFGPAEEKQDFRLWLSRAWADVVRGGYARGLAQAGETKAKVAEAMREYTGYDYRNHLLAGTQYKVLDSRRAIRLYISKYVAKVDGAESPQEWGRNWGFFGAVDSTPYLDRELSRSEYVELRRLVRRWLRARRSSYARRFDAGFSSFILALGVESNLRRDGLTGLQPTILRMLDAVAPPPDGSAWSSYVDYWQELYLGVS